MAMLRAEPDLIGPVASDPTVFRLVDVLAAAGPRALTTIRRARSEVRRRANAGGAPPNAAGEVVVDIDGVLAQARTARIAVGLPWSSPASERAAFKDGVSKGEFDF
ncbi:hypothetical protein ACFYUK_44380 [Nonomuraea wenchangensis]